MELLHRRHLFFLVLHLLYYFGATNGATVRFNWKVQYANVTRLCHTKSLVSINGQFPGPAAHVREGDTVIVNITNLVDYNVTIHWHGVRQQRTAWADGAAYITQCPIQKGKSFVHKFRVAHQRGTLFYHAHSSWLRTTLYGIVIVRPKTHVVHPYPFPTPTTDFPVLIGEWWNSNTEDVVAEALASGAGYNISDALTINGQPGLLYNCSLNDTQVFDVQPNKTYRLRIINVNINQHLYVAVKDHNLTVIELDGEYAKPYETSILVLSPGQTTDALLTANQKPGQYVIGASVYAPHQIGVPYTETPTTAVIRYSTADGESNATLDEAMAAVLRQQLPSFPYFNDSAYVAKYTEALRGYPNDGAYYYYDVPKEVDEELFFTVSYAAQPCDNCAPIPVPKSRLSVAINNITFKDPSVALLQAYYYNINGVYETDFPSVPTEPYNYTGPPLSNLRSVVATKVKVLEYNTSVQIILQDTSALVFESHPMHLHGQHFYVVGNGVGNFDKDMDPAKFNLVDPTFRHTVNVLTSGWAAIRFRATNPGVWLMHCHFDMHTSWGMSMAFIVKDGVGRSQKLRRPPDDLPDC